MWTQFILTKFAFCFRIQQKQQKLVQVGHPEQGARLMKFSKEEIPQPLGSLYQCTRTAQKYCLVFSEKLLCSKLCPLLLGTLGSTGRCMALSFLFLPFRYL